MQNQNRRLLQTITERDDYNTQLMSESVKAKQLQASLLTEKEAMAGRVQHATSSAEVYKSRVGRVEEQCKSFVDQLGKAVEETRQYQALLDSSKRKQAEAEKESHTGRGAVEAAQKELEERARLLAERDAEVEKERFKCKRVEEERERLGARLARVTQDGHEGGGKEETQEELNYYKSIVKCSVCHDRPKEVGGRGRGCGWGAGGWAADDLLAWHLQVVITKCYHLFCSPCIQKNLEIRHRKCPGCGTPFGQNDVRAVYI